MSFFSRCEGPAHHGDLGGKTEKHRKMTLCFLAPPHFSMLVSSVKVDTSVKVAELKLRACLPACLCVPSA